jgi:hypothetical protein
VWVSVLVVASVLLSGVVALIVPDRIADLSKNSDTMGALLLLGTLLAFKWQDVPAS